VGLVFVAFGTSTPEAGVGIVAAIQGQKNIALGNILGSNIANIGLVLGLCAIFWPLKIKDKSIFRREMPIMLLSVILLYLLSLDLVIGRFDGLIFIALFITFCVLSYKKAKKLFNEEEIQEFELKKSLKDTSRFNIILSIVLISLVGVFTGAYLMVEGGVRLAKIFGISPWIIGVTVFALGTSSPELATSLVAAFKKVPCISVGNIVGSNIFNILFVLGIVSLIRPITIEASVLSFELPAVFIFSLFLVIVMKAGYKITRTEGLVMFLGYIGFIVLLIKGF